LKKETVVALNRIPLQEFELWAVPKSISGIALCLLMFLTGLCLRDVDTFSNIAICSIIEANPNIERIELNNIT